MFSSWIIDARWSKQSTNQHVYSAGGTATMQVAWAWSLRSHLLSSGASLELSSKRTATAKTSIRRVERTRNEVRRAVYAQRPKRETPTHSNPHDKPLLQSAYEAATICLRRLTHTPATVRYYRAASHPSSSGVNKRLTGFARARCVTGITPLHVVGRVCEQQWSYRSSSRSAFSRQCLSGPSTNSLKYVNGSALNT